MTETKRPRKKAGRKRLYDEVLPSVAIKLPRWQVQFLENGAGEAGMSAKLRDILDRLVKYGPDMVLPADPGPGTADRRSYKIPPELLEQSKRFGRGKGYTVALRRAILAEMNGQLPKKQ